MHIALQITLVIVGAWLLVVAVGGILWWKAWRDLHAEATHSIFERHIAEFERQHAEFEQKWEDVDKRAAERRAELAERAKRW